MIRRIGELGDGWYIPFFLNEAQVAEHLERLFGFASAKGRDPTSIGINGVILLRPDIPPEEAARDIAKWQRLGATQITVNTESDPSNRRARSAGHTVGTASASWSSMTERIDAMRHFRDVARSCLE
jgi:alkanesulfonate monooxygenase SsuD/methylene tetrahydromethanopterin reductase-like flavin-dependent oxidoreductase (luciferase family)